MPEFKCDNVDEAKQAAFTHAVRSLASQGWEQCTVDGSCAWHQGAPGKHCAIGWLIPWDKQKNVRPCNQDVNAAIDIGGLLYPELEAYIGHSTFQELLADLQVAHDGTSQTDMPMRLWNTGLNHKLEWPEDVPKPDTCNPWR